MLLSFLHHHYERARKGLIKNAIANCHVRGLLSVMLHDEPGNRIRLFFASNHAMDWDGELSTPMPLAIHSHRTPISLVGIFGKAKSRMYRRAVGTSGHSYQRCRFESAIATPTAAPALLDTGEQRHLELVRVQSLGFMGSEYLDSDELHTVTVPAGERAAWLVIEGAADPDYAPVCYTNRPAWDTTGLYQQPARGQVLNALQVCHSELP